MRHYYKLAFTAFRIIGSVLFIYSLWTAGYMLITTRLVSLATSAISGDATLPSRYTVIAKSLPVLFYLVFGILVFAFSKQLAKLAVKGIDRE